MSNHAELVDRYLAIWNEPDANRRRAAVMKLWSEDAVHFTNSLEARGYDAIEARVAKAYDQFVESGNYVFKSGGEPDEHHNGLRIQVEDGTANWRRSGGSRLSLRDSE